MTPEKEAFIKDGASSTPKAATATTHDQAEEEGPASVGVELATIPAKGKVTVRRARSRRQSRGPLPQGEGMMLGIANLLVPLTTRLQPTTAAALKRAGLEQKLRGESPATVQEIAEEAIQDWLRGSGYLE